MSKAAPHTKTETRPSSFFQFKLAFVANNSSMASHCKDKDNKPFEKKNGRQIEPVEITMPKPKAVAQAVTAKKRSMPSLLRAASTRTPTKVRGKQPPMKVIESKEGIEKISDLTPSEAKRGVPIHEIHSAYQSAASSLTMSSTLMSADDEDNMEHPKYSHLVYPESPAGKKRSIERSNSGSLKAPVALKRTESSDSMSQQYVVKKRSLVVGIPVVETPEQQVSPGTDIAIAEKTSPTTQESKSSKPSRKIGFKAVKALISRVHSSGSPRKRSSPQKTGRKKGGNPQRESAPTVIEETKTKLTVKSNQRPVIEPAFSYRDMPPLEPPVLTETRSSSDPSPKRTSYGEEPPDLTETKSSEDASVELRAWEKSKSLEPPEWERKETPRAGSPELRRDDVSPKLAKNSRRRGLEPDAVVACADRHPVDAPEKSATSTGPLKIVGIPVDTDDISELDNTTRGEQQHLNGPQADPRKENGTPISARVARARRASKPINPFDSSSGTSSSDRKAHVVKTNPFESSDSGEADDDPFDRILMENKLDSMSDDNGIPAPKMRPKPKPQKSSQSQKTSKPELSPLKEQNRGNKSTGRQKRQKKFPMQELTVQDDSYVSDLEQSFQGFRVENVELDRYGTDISALDASKDAQDTIATNGSSRKLRPNENLALADSISEGSGNRSNQSAAIQDTLEQPRRVVGQLVDDPRTIVDPRPTTFPEKTPKISNEARKHDHRLESVQSKQQERIGRDPSDGGSSVERLDRDGMQNEMASREDIIDRFFTFIHETTRLSPKSRQKINQSLDMLPSEAKLIVEAGFEKARHAIASPNGLESFYQDDDIEIAFENTDWSTTEALNQFMDYHKRFPLSKMRKHGGSVASGVDTVDASDASELLSELHEFSSVIKGAARRSMKKSLSAGAQGPTWTKQLIDLTGVNSFRDLETHEATWLFDLNSSVETPRNDLESIMTFAEKRLGFSLDRDVLLTAAKMSNPPISSVGAMTPSTNVTDSPFAALREDQSSPSKQRFKFESSTDEQQVEPKKATVKDFVYDSCREAEAVLCGHATIETSISNDSNQEGDKYKVSDDTDKYSQALDDKTFTDKIQQKQTENHAVNGGAKHADHDSDVSSSDGLSVILSKIKRDIKDAEDSLPTPREEKKKSPQLPETQKESNRRDFLDILVEATGSLLCGAVDISGHGFYKGSEPSSNRTKGIDPNSRRTKSTAQSSRRTKTAAPNVFQPEDDPDDPFSGLELESPTASDSTGCFSPQNKKVDTPTDGDQSKFDHRSTTTTPPLSVASSLIPTDTNAFETAGSLLNKGPFSPINEQPSAEEENLTSEEDGDSLSPEKVSTTNDDSIEKTDQTETALMSSAGVNDGPDRNSVAEIDYSLDDGQVQQSPKPNDLPEQVKDYGIRPSRREPPMPEILEQEDLVYHRIATSVDVNEVLEQIPRQKEINTTPNINNVELEPGPKDGPPIPEIKREFSEPEPTLAPKQDVRAIQAKMINGNEEVTVEIVADDDGKVLEQQNGHPSPESKENEPKSAVASDSETQSGTMADGEYTPPSADTKDDDKDEGSESLEPVLNVSENSGEGGVVWRSKDPPPAPESARADTSTSRVSMIRSKFENRSSLDTNHRASKKPDLLGTPEKNLKRFSRISSIRSKFEKRVLGKTTSDSLSFKEIDQEMACDLHDDSVTSEQEEKKEDCPETIDLTNVEGEAMILDPYGDIDVDSNDTENKELIEAVLSGDGTRPESPIFVREDVSDNLLMPIENAPASDIFQPNHIDLVELITLAGEKIDSGFAVDDGRNSDIAFSLSPSTAASSRFLQPYHAQHQLLDAMPILAASSSSDEPDKKSQEVSISSTNVEGAKHCDIDPNTIPGEIAVNKKSTPRSLMESHPLSTNLPWKDDAYCLSCSNDEENSSGEESADLILALTRSETDTEVVETTAEKERGSDNFDQGSNGPKPKVSSIVTSPRSLEQDSPVRKVASPLFASIQKRLSKTNDSQGGTEEQALNAEELFAMLDEKDKGVIDVTTYGQTTESEKGSSSSETSSKSPKGNQFLATLMDRLRVSPSAKRFGSKSCSSSDSVKSRASSAESISNKAQISDKESSDIDDLFQRYDDIVKNMVVLDEERLARVQAKQMASIVMAADSAVDHAAHSPKALSEIARRLRRTASERKREDKVIAYRGEAYNDTRDTSTNGQGSSSVASDSTHPSSHARQLRRDLQLALDKSADIRYSQQQLGNDLTNFQAKLNERRSVSAGRSRSLPSSPAKSYYHRNCCNSSCDCTSIAGDLSTLERSDTAIPRTILTKKTDVTSEDEDDVQSRHLESIRSGLRSSVGRSPRAKARRHRFRRSQG